MSLIRIAKKLLLAIALLSLVWAFTWPETFEAKVIGVTDGDTIKVLRNDKPLKIRLYGVDCPERRQEFGKKARRFTSENVFGKIVKVTIMDTDHYGRKVAKVHVDEHYLNLRLVEEGLAWWYERYAPGDSDLAKAQKSARKAKRGLWSAKNPIPPWEFRRK